MEQNAFYFIYSWKPDAKETDSFQCSLYSSIESAYAIIILYLWNKLTMKFWIEIRKIYTIDPRFQDLTVFGYCVHLHVILIQNFWWFPLYPTPMVKWNKTLCQTIHISNSRARRAHTLIKYSSKYSLLRKSIQSWKKLSCKNLVHMHSTAIKFGAVVQFLVALNVTAWQASDHYK